MLQGLPLSSLALGVVFKVRTTFFVPQITDVIVRPYLAIKRPANLNLLPELAAMSHLASKRIKLDHSSSDFPHTAQRSQLQRRKTCDLSLPNDVDAIATQTLRYLTVFKEHIAAIRDHPERPGTCERLLSKRGAPPPQYLVDSTEQERLRVKMEAVIERRATTVDE